MADEYKCERCGWVLALDRRENHEQYWCTSVEEGGAALENEAEEAISTAIPPELTGVAMQELFSPTCHSLVAYPFVHHKLHLKFEQQSVFGSLDTGGALYVET
jgi:hypothetical protein